uniref:Uncharacterized protein n=1 Tax=Trichuris muris TaxID=70415 RepID=A0A5S6Q3P1_TRIMR
MRIQHHRRSNPVLPRKVERFLPNFKPSISAAAVAAITARFAYLQRHSAFLPCWRVVGASSARAPLIGPFPPREGERARPMPSCEKCCPAGLPLDTMHFTQRKVQICE